MTYRLALDLGANSLGWCLLELDPAGAPCGLRDMGVRIFPDGRDPKTLASLAAARRLARGMRRRRDRYLQRRTALLNALVRRGLMPADATARAALARCDPYALRAAALHRPLAPEELGRAIFHLNQRRGFRSNRRTDRANDAEQGKIAAGAEALKREMARSGAPTLGAWLAERRDAGEWVRARLTGVGAKAEYPFYPTRDLVRAEFDAIWAAQAGWNPALTPEARDEIAGILFHQRPLKPVTPGRCWLEPDEERAPKALPTAQAFRIRQELANLAIRRIGEPDQPLTPEQRALLAAALERGEDLSWHQIRKRLGLSGGESFNLESQAREKLKGAETAQRLVGKKGPLAALWPGLDAARRDALVLALLRAETPEAAIAALIELGLPRAAAEQAERIALPEGHAALSAKAMRAILAAWQEGMTYDKALQAAGYAHHSDDRTGVILDRLPYYGAVLRERLGTGDPSRPPEEEERHFGRAPNPTVHVALNQLRHVVNAILDRHGPPREIVVEVLRELNHSAFQRRQIEKEQAENARRREVWARQLEQLGQRVNGRNLALMRLWHEQSKDGDARERLCPYTGERIGLARLFSGEVEEDHILPFSLTLDDGFANRVLCMRGANRRKTNQTPFQAFGGTPEWPAILERAALLPARKAWRFAPDALERWKGAHEGFLDRHLTDSAYLARLAHLYLRAICDPNRVRVVPGRLTALLRHALGLNSAALLGKGGARKERDDHRHHAIDALAVGLMDRAMLQRLQTAAGRGAELGRLLDDLPPPWPGFLEEARSRLARLVVSFKPDTAPSGKLHNETAYGEIPGAGPREPNVAHRVPIQSLAGWTAKEVRAALGHPALAERVVQALAAAEGKPAQAAALGALAHDVKGGLVRRVRVRERLDNTAAIADRRTGRPYKRVKLDANHRVEFWRLPPRERGAPGKVVTLVVPLLEAARDAEAARLGRPLPDRRPHPAARLLLRLHKDDVVAFGLGEARRLLRVVKFSGGQVVLAPLHEAGNLKARDADRNDPFKYVNASRSRFAEEGARKVHVDPAGRVRDPGPIEW
ncbi:type II CRISPR RNA-guided endonuclease Cas9 [Rubritepida flocculans]|uniref:type II CRISPR RNA-guided endonuclease Cas9 n=1 Tax=Rubritepida flocculans TaxID=182403 RepID=UPI000684E240|nr:type II CRISPR RNA-guided endonuclease Cas9 [Rubritepida flocculans]